MLFSPKLDKLCSVRLSDLLGQFPERVGGGDKGKLAACGGRCVFEPGRAGRFGVSMDGLQNNLLILGKSGVLGEATSRMMLDAHAEIERLRAALETIAAQHSGEVCSIKRSDCMASVAAMALRA